jgi:phosphopantetheinyl transferase
MPLANEEVHLWAVPHTADAWAALCREGHAWLSREEQERQRAIARPARARRFLLGRILLRKALAGHLACDPAALVFARTENGKLVAERTLRAGLDFSLSHSDTVTVLSVARAKGLGVDLEPLRRGAAVRRIAGRIFPEAEREQIEASGDAAEDLALSLWTLKEAAVKATGSTIWRGLGDFAFDVRGAVPVWLAPPPVGVPRDWRLALGRLGSDHRLAVALWRPAARAGAVVWKTHVLGGGGSPREEFEVCSGRAG